MSDTTKPFSGVNKADETIALLIQHQPNFLESQPPCENTAENLAAFLSTLRQKLTDMYNLNPPS